MGKNPNQITLFPIKMDYKTYRTSRVIFDPIMAV